MNTMHIETNGRFAVDWEFEKSALLPSDPPKSLPELFQSSPRPSRNRHRCPQPQIAVGAIA